MLKDDELLPAIRQILFLEWDPLHVHDNESCRGEYDSYARRICSYLREGADEYKLAAYLHKVQEVSMGLRTVDGGLNRRVAQRLLRLVR